MLIYPAIDLIDGRCVRLRRGDFDQITHYGDPVDQARAFADTGATWLHIVDLDGAKAGNPAQTALIERIARSCPLAVQSGGGVRSANDIRTLLAAGVARAVIGSVAARAPETVCAWLVEFGPEKLCCAFDVRPKGKDYLVAVAGWRETTDLTLKAALNAYADSELAHVLITDISRDGDLAGSNQTLVASVARNYPMLAIQASGGVSSLEDLARLRESGAAGVIIGRALYENRFTLEAALAN